MSLLEWLFESYDPGPVGTIDTAPRHRGERPRIWVLTFFALSVGALAIWAYVVLVVWQARTMSELALYTLLTVAYLYVGYSGLPEPDRSNLGWFGGLVDNPFRFSDDINRFLFFLRVFLWPGRFISESLVDMARLAREMRPDLS